MFEVGTLANIELADVCNISCQCQLFKKVSNLLGVHNQRYIEKPDIEVEEGAVTSDIITYSRDK